MPIILIPTGVVAALEESTTHIDFDGADGWAMSRHYTMRVVVYSK
jgi:hypothetical protein